MLNYIRAEFYKVAHRKYPYIALIILLLLEGLLVSGWAFTNYHGNTIDFYTGFTMLVSLLSIGFIASGLTCDMVLAGQNKHGALKNEVSFGLSRTRIYFGKLIVQTCMSLLYCVVMVGFYFALCWVTLYHFDPAKDVLALKISAWSLSCALPVWLGCQALCNACLFLVHAEVAAMILAMFPFFALDSVLDIAGKLFYGTLAGDILAKVLRYLPGTILSESYQVVGVRPFMGRAWVVGAFWMIAPTLLGLYFFHRKEIK